MNGNTLKLCFMGIVGTLCILLIVLTIGAATDKLPIENYTRLIGILGIPALFGMIAQAFIHANIADVANKQVSDEKKLSTLPNGADKKGQAMIDVLLFVCGLIMIGGCLSASGSGKLSGQDVVTPYGTANQINVEVNNVEINAIP